MPRTTLFAFLSYKQEHLSAISILHTLIFQLAIGEDHFDENFKQDLRAKVFHIFQSSQRSLKSDTSFARQTLTDLLECVGPTFIIIDGLDEIPERERMDILTELLEIFRSSAEVRLLISSRAEDDIDKELKKTSSKFIRVDDMNRGCIHAYIDVTSDNWLRQSGFDVNACSEIKRLLIPLSAKAKGRSVHYSLFSLCNL
jgi:hypothetical protein